ncbi:MAG: hypothetical protein ACHQ53_04910 [Polyangiales bacterium]
MSLQRVLRLLLLVPLCAAGLYAARRSTQPSKVAAAPTPAPRAPASVAKGATTLPPAAPPAQALAPPAEVAFVAIGGGATPDSTEVSLEQDLALAEQALPGPGVSLFAGGQDSQSVRVLDDAPVADELLVRLGELFQPRVDHRSRYRAPSLHAAAASLQAVEAQLVAAFSRGSAPLLVYVAAHGQQGEHARDNSVVLWGGQGLSVSRLAELHEAHPRPLRVISASCYSGGFAELAFAHADEAAGPARAPRCGLFAGTWDRETSGCDPDPDRRKQEAYSLHLLQALRGRDRDGAVLRGGELDLDADGRVSLLEAHARATIAAESIDVPTTTSERYLRAVQHRKAASDPRLLPEMAAVVERLGARLGLRDERAARERLQQVSARLRELEERADRADDQADASFGELSARLLGRWPALGDAYHPDFAATLARDRHEIERALDDWPEAQRHAGDLREQEEQEGRVERVEVEEALLTRLLRAYETLAYAAALRARGGPEWAYYKRLLACERTVPGSP